MSQSSFPTDPYGNRPPNPYVQGAPGQYLGTGYPPPPSPYARPGFPQQFNPPPSKGSSSVLWILGIVGGLTLFCCLGCGGFFTVALNVFMAQRAEHVRVSLEDSPKAVEELGTPIKVKMNFGESISEGKSTDVFDVLGPKGSGKVRADIKDDFVFDCILTANGKTIDVLEDAESEMDKAMADDSEIAPIEK